MSKANSLEPNSGTSLNSKQVGKAQIQTKPGRAFAWPPRKAKRSGARRQLQHINLHSEELPSSMTTKTVGVERSQSIPAIAFHDPRRPPFSSRGSPQTLFLKSNSHRQDTGPLAVNSHWATSATCPKPAEARYWDVTWSLHGLTERKIFGFSTVSL